jgi:hypothetical protein
MVLHALGRYVDLHLARVDGHRVWRNTSRWLSCPPAWGSGSHWIALAAGR